jgi:3-hydroxyisobutyrate dehydrogenase-like beta-hydroxyacid dehydrogenase
MSEGIGFLGAGQLGEPMVNRLLGAGHEVLVYARRPDVRDRLAAQGATLADTVPELAAASDVLISCLFSDAQLLELGSGPDGFVANAKSDALFVSHTTGTVTTLQDLAATSPTALEVLDAPVSGTADHIAKGELTVLVGGPSEAVERARPVLEAYANPIVATGALGSALSIKLINNLLFAANAICSLRSRCAAAVATHPRTRKRSEPWMLSPSAPHRFSARTLRHASPPPRRPTPTSACSATS